MGARNYELIQRALHGDLATHTMFDMDGVLTPECWYDEPDVANHDELVTHHQDSAYYRHLHDAPPFLIPTKPILAIVTGRMSFYKAQTQAWLDRYDVKTILGTYASIFARPGHRPLRDVQGNTAHNKAGAYEHEQAHLFIESKRWQAEQIYEENKKPVFCIETMRLYGKM